MSISLFINQFKVMTKHIPSGQIKFEEDYSAAVFDDGSVVKFTRLERRALEALSKSAGRILTRSQILDTISEPGSEKNDRNIDFLINRIRNKLGDVAQAPRFIGTQYGEGYIWLHSQEPMDGDFSKAFAIIGPFLGVDDFKETPANATELAGLLRADLRLLLGADKDIKIVPNLTPAQRVAGPALTIQLGFFQNSTELECIATTHNGKIDRIVDIFRFVLGRTESNLLTHSKEIAHRAFSSHWRDAAETGAKSKPLAVAIYDAVQPNHRGYTDLPQNIRDSGAHQTSLNGYESLTPNFSNYEAVNAKRGFWSWKDADRRLKLLRKTDPDNPAYKVMWATHIHAKYVKKGISLFKQGRANCAADEAEIESLILSSLDFVQGNPGQTAMAAKLLYFVNQGYKDLALEMTQNAYRDDPTITSTLAIRGQMLGFAGKVDEAEALLTQAVALSDKGSMSQAYALYMLMQLHASTGDRDKLSAALKQMYRIRPAAIIIFELFFTNPDAPSLRAKALALLIKRDLATAMLRNANYLSARLYNDPKHRENALLSPVNLFMRRFGPSVVPDDVAIHLPNFAPPETR